MDFCLKIWGWRSGGGEGGQANFGNVKIYESPIPEIGPILSLSDILLNFITGDIFFVKNSDFYISDLVFHNFRFLKCHFIFQIFWGFSILGI